MTRTYLDGVMLTNDGGETQVEALARRLAEAATSTKQELMTRTYLDGVMLTNNRGETQVEALARRLAEAATSTKQEFCQHRRQKRTDLVQSNERIDCLDCGKWWID